MSTYRIIPSIMNLLTALGLLLILLVGGCASSGKGGSAGSSADVQDPGTVPKQLEFLYVFENTRDAPYYPIDGMGAVAYAPDGTLVFSDVEGGRIHGLDPRTQQWFRFEDGPDRPFRPVDLQVDGLTMMVLDLGSRMLLRYRMDGSFKDRLVNFRYIDPVFPRVPSAFDVDRDGRVVVTDVSEQQVLILDPFMALTQIVGESGPHTEQFDDPSGIVFLPDAGFVVADRGNRRLQRFNRLGYYEDMAGGEFDVENPLVAPQGIDCDSYGNVFVADPPMGKVHVFSRSLRYLFSLGAEVGLQASLEIPIDVAVGPDDLLAITDRGRQAVLVYRIHYD